MILKHKSKKAVALRYNKDERDAPYIVAKSGGALVTKLLELAEKHSVVVYEDGDLVEALYAMPVGDDISPQLYKAVAEVIAYCYRLKGSM